MQPTYLPWSGYFNLISRVDKFVFLDDVQFEKRSWQIRNRVLLQGRECLLSVPVRKVIRETSIRDIVISNDSDWRRKHWLTLHNAYKGAAHGEEVLSLLQPFFIGDQPELLSDFNQSIIRRIATALSLNAEFICASDLQCGGARSDHLGRICKELNCFDYISPRGSAAYLEEDKFEEISGLKLTFQDYEPEPYPQLKSTNFVSHLSIVDVIANIGVDAARVYIS